MADSINSWEALALVWIAGLERGGVVYYENMLRNLDTELVRLMRMLGVDAIDPERLNCVLKHANYKGFKRENRSHFLKLAILVSNQ